MLERTETRFGMKPASLAADSAYGSADSLAWLVKKKEIAGPGRISGGVLERDMHDRLPFPPGDRAVRPLGMAPVGAGDIFPPVAHVARPQRSARHAKHCAAGDQHLGPGAWIQRRIERPLGECDVSGGGYELGKSRVGDGEPRW